MSRRHSAEKREIIPDPKFGDVIVTKFMNSIMYDGKKSVAEQIVYGAFDIIEGRAKSNPLEVFKAALDNVAPRSRSAPAASAVRPTRCPSRCAPSAVRLSRSAGSSRRARPQRQDHGRASLVRAARRLEQPGQRREEARRTPTGWPRPTGASRTIAGNG
jgi:small subunit ribosomal protein S7